MVNTVLIAKACDEFKYFMLRFWVAYAMIAILFSK